MFHSHHTLSLGHGDLHEASLRVRLKISWNFVINYGRIFNREPIKCLSDKSNYISYMETKCWVEGVYLEPSLFDYNYSEAIAVGVGSPKFRDASGEKPQLIYHNYYQWVVPVLALQAFFLYIPRLLWQNWENGVMGKILKNSGEKFNFLSFEVRFLF